MATDIYQTISNQYSGEAFRGISFSEDKFVMQWTVQPKGYVPFEHVHLNQDEIFHIKAGEVKLVIDGKEIIGRAGETVTVPKGAKHIAYNNTDGVLDCVVEYTPGLDHDKFMQCFAGLTSDGFYDKKGQIRIPMMGYFLAKMKAKCMARPTSIPAPVFNLGLRFMYLRGMLSGWKKLYDKYTGE